MKCFFVIILTLFLGVIALCFPVSLVEATMVFADDFSSGEIEKWQITKTNSSSWTVSDGILVGKIVSSSSVSELIPRPEFWYEGWGDYRFSVDMMPVSGADRNLGWNYQDPRNWYEAHFVGNMVELYRLREGQTGFVSGHQFFMTPLTWHHLVVEVQEQKMKLWVDGWLVADVMDWFADGRQGSIALKVGTGAIAPTEVWFDNVRVELLPEVDNSATEVEALMQTDSRWANDIYDHAMSWSNQPTIERWGCALTSLVMILRKHGFTQFTDAVEIDPGSLNQWLAAQPDGYIADGWVNWLAAARLTRQLVAQKYPGFNSLKFSSWWPIVGQSSVITKIASELVVGRPVIAALSNHFFVADGLLGGAQDIQIKDPWYQISLLGQHLAANRIPISLRLIEPVTAQSSVVTGWLLAIENGGSPELINESGVLATDWQVVDGPERGESEDDSATNWQVWWIPSRNQGKYQLRVLSRDQSQPPQVVWYEYFKDDTVRKNIFGGLELEFDRQFVVGEDGITWLNQQGLAWNWVELAEWWQEHLGSLGTQDAEAWIRIRYLLFSSASISTQGDDRYRSFLEKTVNFYRSQSESLLLQELLSRLPLTGSF